MKYKTLLVSGMTMAIVSLVLLAASGVGAYQPDASSAQGGAPMLISYQGILTDPATGEPKPDGSYPMTFRIYTTDTGGSSIWSEAQAVSVNEGLFNVLLGSVNPLLATVFSGTDAWLEVEVGGETLTPRQRIVSAAYAIQAQEAANAGALDGLDSSDLQRRVTGSCVGGNAIRVIHADGTVTCEPLVGGAHDHWGESWSGSGLGLGLTSSNYDALSVSAGRNGLYISSAGDDGIHIGSASDKGVVIESAGNDGVRVVSAGRCGVYAKSNSASDSGVYGTAAMAGTAGVATATSGEAYGVRGESRSSGGCGGYFENTASTGSAEGVRGMTPSTGGRGVVGWATASNGETIGVYGRSDSTEGKGVLGKGLATSGPAFGVYGESRSASGAGVYGRTAAMGGIGVWGYGGSGVGGYFEGARGVTGQGGSSQGVRGESSGDHGVYGESSSAAHAGVYGRTAAMGGTGVWGYGGSGVGGYFEGAGGVRAKGGSSYGLRASSNSGNLIEAYDGDPWNLRFRVSNAGNVSADGSFSPGGADFAEMLPAVSGLEPGDVLVVGPEGKLARSTQAYATNVVGVHSTNPGFVGGASDDEDLEGKVPLSVLGVVPVKASAENGPIRPGDLLTTSATPGRAMRATEPKIGTVIGKALESLDQGSGVIEMLVMLQ